jgi:hypothetical protein
MDGSAAFKLWVRTCTQPHLGDALERQRGLHLFLRGVFLAEEVQVHDVAAQVLTHLKANFETRKANFEPMKSHFRFKGCESRHFQAMDG